MSSLSAEALLTECIAGETADDKVGYMGGSSIEKGYTCDACHNDMGLSTLLSNSTSRDRNEAQGQLQAVLLQRATLTWSRNQYTDSMSNTSYTVHAGKNENELPGVDFMQERMKTQTRGQRRGEYDRIPHRKQEICCNDVVACSSWNHTVQTWIHFKRLHRILIPLATPSR
jgi:hypothetical protein